MTNGFNNGPEQSHPSWQAVLEDFERKLDVLASALQEARQAGQRLASMHAATQALAASTQPVAAQPPAPVEGVLSAPTPPTPQPAIEPVVEEDLTRNEVRRAVEQTRYDMETGGRMAAVGWAMPRDFWPGVTPEVPPEVVDQPDDEDPARNEVRRMVEAAKAELAKGDLKPWEPDEDKIEDSPAPAAPEVTKPAAAPPAMPSWTNMSITAETPSSEPPTVAPAHQDTAADEEARREEVRMAVQRARNEMESGGQASSREPAQSSPVSDDQDARRDDVRRAVAQAKAEMTWSLNVDEEPESQSVESDAGDEDIRRDDVRRAVEQARAEMSSSGLRMFDDSAPPESDGLQPSALFTAFSGGNETPTWQKNKDAELAGLPASIVIEDDVGRVELARVYDTLNRVERPSASLLNYSPHSVTVGLAAMEALPEPEVMMRAIQAAFGRACRVALDGSRMSVKIGESEQAA